MPFADSAVLTARSADIPLICPTDIQGRLAQRVVHSLNSDSLGMYRNRRTIYHNGLCVIPRFPFDSLGTGALFPLPVHSGRPYNDRQESHYSQQKSRTALFLERGHFRSRDKTVRAMLGVQSRTAHAPTAYNRNLDRFHSPKKSACLYDACAGWHRI